MQPVRTAARPWPPARALARGLSRHLRLSMAARAPRSPRVQRDMARRTAAGMLHWYDRPGDPVADLHEAERTYWSQHGEDGLLAELVERVGVANSVFVEIGASDGEENCTRALAERGWRGYWFESDTDRAAAAEKVAANLDVSVQRAHVESNTVVKLMRDAGVPDEVDVAVIDVDGNDMWILRRFLGAFSPRIVVAEYNSTFPPDVFWFRRNRRNARWDDTFRHGASLDAMAWTAGRAGYELVACDSAGANAFFVRNDLARAAVDVPHSVEDLYQPLLVMPPAIGHPWYVDSECPRIGPSELDQLKVVDATIRGRRPLAGSGHEHLISLTAVLENGTGQRLTSWGPTPVLLSAHLLDGDGGVVEFDADRNWVHGGLPAGGRATAGAVFAIRDQRVCRLRLCLVQEAVGWGEAGAYDLVIR